MFAKIQNKMCIGIFSDENLAAHENGKRHKSNLNVRNTEEAGKRKVYVGRIGGMNCLFLGTSF